MNFYAIRHKPSGFYMPRYSGRAGGTYEEPTDKKPPRLFTRHQDAKAALAWWLEGKAVAKYDHEGEFYDLVTKPVEGRRSEDMEIVKVSLELIGVQPL